VVTKTAIRKDRDGTTGRHQRLQPHEASILEVVASLRQFLFPDGQPQQRRRAAMPGHQIKREGCLIVTIETGPIHRDNNLAAGADQMRNPAGEAVPDVDLLVAEQPVDLLDRVLGHRTACLCQGLPDDRNRQRRAGHRAQSRPGQAINPLCVQVMLVHAVDERTDVLQTPAQPTIHLLHDTLKSANTQYAVGNPAVVTLDMDQ
jgi:hypothetical protein